MEDADQELLETLKNFEAVNKKVMQLSRRLSELKEEISRTKRKISSFNS